MTETHTGAWRSEDTLDCGPFFYALQGGAIFDRPASETCVALWVVLVVVALAALVPVGIGVSRSGRPVRREKPLSA